MVPVLSREQMRQFDSRATAICGVPSVVLMENAGIGATDALMSQMLGGGAEGKRVVVVCGAGNNGGDGLVIARQLAVRGGRPAVFLMGDAPGSAEVRTNLDAWRQIGGAIDRVSVGQSMGVLTRGLAGADAIVDALFGTGLDRPLGDWHAEVIAAMNAAVAPRFAVDLPSGLDANTGQTLGALVNAQLTATFGHHKLGLLTPNGAMHAGRVIVVPIGVPPSLVSDVGTVAQLLEAHDVSARLGRRSVGTHKNASGHVLVVGGSPGKVGAPQLVAHGALRAGAGLATILTDNDTAAAIDSGVLEVMTARFDKQDIAASVKAALRAKDAVVVGPGLGVDDRSRAVVDCLLANWQGPVVVDADALTLFAGRPAALMTAKNAILTPHPGEAGRLLGRTAAEVEKDRFGAARAIATATGAVVVLKGAHSIVAAQDAELAISPIAHSALATAGSGDTLGGIIAALACAMPPFEAAWVGVMLHGLAGVAASRARRGTDRGLVASEIADALPGLFGELGS
jgi:hydroxyethylthiazole kinase-like uncharacterized protein yjeF